MFIKKSPWLLLFAISLFASAPYSSAADVELSGTRAWPALVGTDTYIITGGASGTVTLSSTLPFGMAAQIAYADSVRMTNAVGVGDGNSGAELRGNTVGEWAYMAYNGGRLFTGTESSASDVRLDIDKVIFDYAGGSTTNGSVLMFTAGSGTRALIIGGDVVFMNNNMASGNRGGAAYVQYGSLIFEGDAAFINNAAPGLGGAIALRGLAARQRLTFEKNAVFVGNRTDGGGGAILSGNPSAGAETAHITVDGTTVFMNNQSGASGAAGQHGGAISQGGNNAGSGKMQFNGPAWFENNSASGHGGAIHIYGNGPLTFADAAIFISNTAGRGQTADYRGGAISNTKGGVTATGTISFLGTSTFIGNTAARAGGAIALENPPLLSFAGNTVFESNSAGAGATASGGAIYLDLASGTVAFGGNTNFSENTATGHGGAIALPSTLQKLEFRQNILFENNTAGYNTLSGTAHGGGLYLGAAVSSITFSGSTRFSGNETTGFGGGIYATGVNTIAFTKSVVFENNKSGLNTTVNSIGGGIALEGTGNLSFAMDNGAVVRFEGNMTGQWGGAIYSRGGADLTFSGSAASFSFLHNVVSAANANGGGAIYVRDKSIIVDDNVTDFVVRGNFAGAPTRNANGGAFNVTTGRIVLGGKVTFENNQAASMGGAITANSASIYAGGIIAITGQADFTNNAAFYDGGAIYYNGATANTIRIETALAGSSGINFTGNTAGRSGGAIYLNTDSTDAGIDLTAREADIVFSNNKHGVTADRSAVDAEAIRSAGASGYMTATGGVLNDLYFGGTNQALAVHADAGRTVALRSGIANAATVTTTVTKTGSGAYIIGADSDIDANTTIQAGSFMLENNAAYGRSASTGTFAAQANATIGGSGTIQAATITLAADSILHATGTLAFNSANTITYAGVKYSGAGLVTGLGPITTTALEIGDGTHTTGQQLSFGSSALTLNSGTLNMSVFGGTDSDTLSAGSIALGSGTTLFNFNNFVSGTYTLITTTGGITNTGALKSAVNGTVIENSRWTSNYTILSGNTLQAILYKGGSEQLVWNTGNGNWDFSAPTWTGADGFLDGDAVAFSSVTGTITLGAGQMSPSQMDVGGSGTVTFAGAGDIVTDKTKWDATGSPAPATVLEQLKKTGDGTLVFANTGSNQFAGGISIGGGVIQFNNANQLGTTGTNIQFTAAASGTLRPAANGLQLSNAIEIGSSSRAAFDVQSGSFTFAGSVTGNAGTLAKTGAGKMILATDHSSYAGATSVEEGALALREKLGGAITLQSGATLIGSGSVVAGSLIANAGSFIKVGETAGVADKLNIAGTLTLDGATLLYDLIPIGTPPAGAHIDSVAANAVALGGINTFDFSADLVSGTHHLIYSAPGGISGFDENNFITKVGGNLFSASRTGVFYNITSGSTLDMVVATTSATQTWKGTTDGVWRSGTATENWAGMDSYFNSGDAVIFNDTVSNNQRDVQVQSTGVTVSEMTVDSAQNYTIRGGGIRGTNDASETQGIANPSGKLIKKGLGTLILSNSANVFAGGIWIENGNLQGNIVSFGTNTIRTSANTSVIFDQAVSGTYKNIITGSSAAIRGDVIKKNTGALAISGTINAANFTQDAGDVSLAANGSLDVAQYTLNNGAFRMSGGNFSAGAFNIAAGGTLAHTGTLTLSAGGLLANAGLIKIGKADGRATSGALVVPGNYRGDGGAVELHTVFNEGGAATSTDQLIIRGDASGHTFLRVKNIGGAGGVTGHGATDGIQLVVIGGNNAATFDAINADTGGSRFVVGGFDYALVAGDGGMYFQSTALSPEIPAMCALPAIASIIGQTTLDTVQQRMGEIRYDPEYNHGGWWLRDTYNNTQLKTDLFANTRFHTNAAQVGADITLQGRANWSIGIFVTHVDAAGRIGGDSASVTDLANGGGVYVNMQHKNFYAALTLKGEDNKYEISAPESILKADGISIGASIETGYVWKTKKIGTLEPQFQLSYQNYNMDSTGDIFQRGYDFDNPDSLNARASLLWRATFEFSDGTWLQPWLRAGASYEFLNRYDMRVLDAAEDPRTFSNDMRGEQFLADIGMTWGITQQFAFNFAGSYNTGERYKGFTISAGARYIW